MSNQGFGPNGIAKDSNAAKMQKEIGDVKKDSGFANAQSAGARGEDVGFGTGGITKDSPAAQTQGDIGNVKKGSGFADAQANKK